MTVATTQLIGSRARAHRAGGDGFRARLRADGSRKAV